MALGETPACLEALRRARPWLVLRHAALCLSLLAGVALLAGLGPATARAAWLHLKLGLVVVLVLPLEGMHAWVCHVWIAGALRATASPPFPRELARGLGVEEMIRALEVPLLGVGVPLLAWLSLARPSWP
jgi:hypothetical protein